MRNNAATQRLCLRTRHKYAGVEAIYLVSSASFDLENYLQQKFSRRSSNKQNQSIRLRQTDSRTTTTTTNNGNLTNHVQLTH